MGCAPSTLNSVAPEPKKNGNQAAPKKVYHYKEVPVNPVSTIAVKPEDSSLSEKVLRDRIRGVVYGQAAGDAVGLLTEFFEPVHIEKYYGKDFAQGKIRLRYHMLNFDPHRMRWKAGDWTDDSDQALLLLETVLETGGTFDPVIFAGKLHRWLKRGFPELGDTAGVGQGETTHGVCSHKDFLTKPFEVSERIWIKQGRNGAANGSIMRTSVVAIPHFQSDTAVLDDAAKMGQVTHFDHRCVFATQIVCLVIARLLRGAPCKKVSDREKLVEDVLSTVFTSYHDQEASEQWEEHIRKYVFAKDLAELKLSDDHSIGYVLKSLGASMWAFRLAKSFEHGVTAVTLEGGDADSNACVAGAVLGARLGASSIPKCWIDEFLHPTFIDRRYQGLLELLFPPQD